MKISKHNYESFFLDYHEGNLSEELKQEVLVFLDSHPELKEEFESFEIISLTEKPVAFPGKDKLKKNFVNEYNYKTLFVAYEENDLDAEGKKQVEQFIEVNPGYKPELEILKQTKILPDYSIRFENKSSLKKGGLVIPLWVRIAAAACLLIGLLSYWMIQQKPKQEFVIEPKTSSPSFVPSNEKQVIEELKTVAEKNKERVEKEYLHQSERKPVIRKVKENQDVERLADRDSFHLSNQDLAIQPHPDSYRDSNVEPQTNIIINENKNGGVRPASKLVVLDENDLAELGLKPEPQKTPEESKSLLANAVNGVGKIFNVNAHYDKEKNPDQSKYTETLALGPVAITRTVLR